MDRDILFEEWTTHKVATRAFKPPMPMMWRVAELKGTRLATVGSISAPPPRGQGSRLWAAVQRAWRWVTVGSRGRMIWPTALDGGGC
jgi:hypothetical protein